MIFQLAMSKWGSSLHQRFQKNQLCSGFTKVPRAKGLTLKIFKEGNWLDLIDNFFDQIPKFNQKKITFKILIFLDICYYFDGWMCIFMLKIHYHELKWWKLSLWKKNPKRKISSLKFPKKNPRGYIFSLVLPLRFFPRKFFQGELYPYTPLVSPDYTVNLWALEFFNISNHKNNLILESFERFLFN